MKYEYGYKAYVADDGNFGVDSIATFDYELFIDRYPKVWDIVDRLSDYARFDFIIAVLDQDESELARIAEDYDFPLADVLDKE